MDESARNGYLDAALRDMPAMRGHHAKLVSLMTYHADYDIYNHYTNPVYRPLAVFGLHDKENVYEGGPIFSLIRRFSNLRVADLGFTWTEVSNMPFVEASLIFDMAVKKAAVEASSVDSALTGLKMKTT